MKKGFYGRKWLLSDFLFITTFFVGIVLYMFNANILVEVSIIITIIDIIIQAVVVDRDKCNLIQFTILLVLPILIYGLIFLER